MTEPRLLSLITPYWRAAREKNAEPAAIGVQSESRWQGPAELILDGIRIPVAQCDSVLQTREVLASHREDWVVLLTPLNLTALGAEVQARLLRHRLLQVEPWDLLRDRFNARSFDASLLGKTALAEAAVEAIAAETPDPAPAGVLTAEAVWRVVLKARLGIDDAKPDPRQWLEWARDAASTARWKALNKDLRDLLIDWAGVSLGDFAKPFFACLDAGYGAQGMALGLALSALRQPGGGSDEKVAMGQALARVEQLTGGLAVSPAALKLWSEAAEQWAAQGGDAAAVLAETTEADRILDRLGATGFACLGRYSPVGFLQRLGAFSVVVEAVAKGAGRAPEMEQALGALEDHQIVRFAAKERAWLERARMAARLARWITTPAAGVANWNEAVSQYVKSGAWVDYARQVLASGDEPEPVAGRWQSLSERVAKRRDEENLAFAKELAVAVKQDNYGDAVVPVERVLERVVAPWAKDGVLLIVMDGMSYAVWRELATDLQVQIGGTWSWREDGPLPPAVSVLPSMTNCSRASLLAGKLVAGGQDVEKRGFAENAGLVAVSKAGVGPVLFHKDEVGSGALDIAESVRKEIANPNRRVVGVVVNVIDDSLEGAEQRAFRWSLEQVPVLRTLLREAEKAGRAVVFASDHGHVLDRGAAMRRNSTADRYRAPDQNPVATDEVVLSGRRVLEHGGSVIALAVERVRYTPVRKVGYHGGATPQECLSPLAVLSPRKGPEGWSACGEDAPLWWYASEPAVAVETTARKPKTKAPQPLLDGLAEPDWVRDVLASEVYAQQKALAGRTDDARVEQAIRALVARNGVLLKPALASRLEMQQFRIDGFLSSLRRLLNVEGYAVLSVDETETVRLNIELLKTQFL